MSAARLPTTTSSDVSASTQNGVVDAHSMTSPRSRNLDIADEPTNPNSAMSSAASKYELLRYTMPERQDDQHGAQGTGSRRPARGPAPGVRSAFAPAPGSSPGSGSRGRSSGTRRAGDSFEDLHQRAFVAALDRAGPAPASSSMSRTCRSRRRLSAESCTQAVPGVKVTIIARTASPFGSFELERDRARTPSACSRARPGEDRPGDLGVGAEHVEHHPHEQASPWRPVASAPAPARASARPCSRRRPEQRQDQAPGASVPALTDCMSRIHSTKSAADSSGRGQQPFSSRLLRSGEAGGWRHRRAGAPRRCTRRRS